MADRYLLESGSPDGYLLEDGSGVLLLDAWPLASTLTDNFDDNSTDAAKWTVDQFENGTTTGVTVAETSAQLQVTGPSATSATRFSGYVSVNTYSLDAVFVKLLHTTVQANELFYLGAGQDANNSYCALVDSGTLYFTKRVAGVQTILTTVGTWSPTTHKLFRLRWGGPSDDTVYLDTATSSASDPPVSGDWTNRASAARDTAINLDACKLAIGGGLYASVLSPTTFIFDGFNTATTGAGATTVTPSTGHITFTGYQPAITLTTAVSPSVGHLAFGGKVPSVSLTVNVSPAKGHLTFGGKIPTVVPGVNVNPLTGHLSFGGHTPALTFTTAVSPATGHLTFSGKVPSVALNVNVFPVVGHLILGGKVPSLSLTINPATGHLIFTGYVPGVSGASVASTSFPLKVTYRHRGRNC